MLKLIKGYLWKILFMLILLSMIVYIDISFKYNSNPIILIFPLVYLIYLFIPIKIRKKKNNLFGMGFMIYIINLFFIEIYGSFSKTNPFILFGIPILLLIMYCKISLKNNLL